MLQWQENNTTRSAERNENRNRWFWKPSFFWEGLSICFSDNFIFLKAWKQSYGCSGRFGWKLSFRKFTMTDLIDGYIYWCCNCSRHEMFISPLKNDTLYYGIYKYLSLYMYLFVCPSVCMLVVNMLYSIWRLPNCLMIKLYSY